MTTSTKLNLKYIDPNELIPNPWNSNVMSLENEAKLMESMKRNDMFKPVIVRQLGDGRYQILGGEHRAKIAKKLKMQEIPVAVLNNITDQRAKEIGMADNARYGSDDSLKLSELINSLETPEILSEILPYSEIEIDTLMSATKIDLDSLSELMDDDLDTEEPIEQSTPSKTHTIMRFKVSLEDADKIQDIVKGVMKSNDFTGSDALTNAGDALVHLLLGND